MTLLAAHTRMSRIVRQPYSNLDPVGGYLRRRLTPEPGDTTAQLARPKTAH